MLHDLIQTQEWGLNGFTLVAKLSCHLRERQYTLDFELRGSSCGIVLLRKTLHSKTICDKLLPVCFFASFVYYINLILI